VSRRALGSTALLLGLGLASCGTNEPRYFPGAMPLEVDGSGMEAKQTLQVPFRQATNAEEASRQKLISSLGYPVPWLRDDRVHVELRYTITNLGDSEAAFLLNIDGASEFARYDEDAVAAAFVAADMDAPSPRGLFQVRPPAQSLAPGEVLQGAVLEDDFHEMALDLDAMGRWMAPNFPAVLLYRSDANNAQSAATNAVEYAMVPPDLIRPALWEITPRFNSTQPMRCEFLVRVRDDDQRLWEDGDVQFLPTPTTYTPTIAPKM
jgi:hypothetical protein